MSETSEAERELLRAVAEWIAEYGGDSREAAMVRFWLEAVNKEPTP